MRAAMIRVLLAVESPVSERLQKLIQQDADIEIVGQVTDPVDVLVAVKETQADVVIQQFPQSGSLPGICSNLLMEYPHLLVIGIPPRQDRVFACRQRIARKRLPALEDLIPEIHRGVPAAK
jgi:DNA-binding NarL/FixJ family response regulator